MNIELDGLRGSDVEAFLEAHVEHMKAVTPLESKHALDLEGLRSPEVSFWTGRDESGVVACGAIKEIGVGHGEVKAMRTAPDRRGEGLGAAMLEHLLESAVEMRLGRLSLETGSSDHFLPARNLYRRYGFEECDPFGSYKLDPHSVFMTLALSPG